MVINLKKKKVGVGMLLSPNPKLMFTVDDLEGMIFVVGFMMKRTDDTEIWAYAPTDASTDHIFYVPD